jgi:hypothetical protein
MQPSSILVFTYVFASSFLGARNKTIGFFSEAPLTHKYTHLSPSECANECDSINTCQAWLFIVNAKKCQLYRSAPVAQAKSAGFIMGS